MRSKPLVALLAELSFTQSLSRPHVSNDNPFIESHFKTMKYRPDFPKKFVSLRHARAFLSPFFEWYNCEHRHSGIGYMTPQAVHDGSDKKLRAARQEVLDVAYEKFPQRFVRGKPKPAVLPEAVWINPPTFHAPVAAGNSEVAAQLLKKVAENAA